MIVGGRIFRLPESVWDDVNTDLILAGPHLRLPEEELGSHAFEGIIADFPALVRDRPILVAGRNMGSGSSREQAPKALLGCGVRLIVAQSFGSIFFRNALNLGLALLKLPADEDIARLLTDERLEADPESGRLSLADGRTLMAQPLGPHLVRILRAGGILPLLRSDPAALDG